MDLTPRWLACATTTSSSSSFLLKPQPLHDREATKWGPEGFVAFVLCVLCVHPPRRIEDPMCRSDPLPKRQYPEAANTPESCCRVDQRSLRAQNYSPPHLQEGDTNYCARAGKLPHCTLRRSSQQDQQRHYSLEAAATTRRCGPRLLQAHARTGREASHSESFVQAVRRRAHKSSSFRNTSSSQSRQTDRPRFYFSFSSLFPICSLSCLHSHVGKRRKPPTEY